MPKIAIAGTPEGAANFIEALSPLDAEVYAVLEETEFDKYDGLILPGGADISPDLFGEENHGSLKIERDRDLRQLEIFDHFRAAGKPVLGVCKGHQLINVALGGTVCQHIPEYARHQWVQQDQAHGSVCTPGCFLSRLYGTSFPINSAHHQSLGRIAEGFTIIQHSDDGVIEAMIHNTLPFIGLQWHPERMTGRHLRPDTVNGDKIFDFFLKVIREEASIW